MIKGNGNILKLFLILICIIASQHIQAQVDVVPFEDDETVFYFDSIAPATQLKVTERKVPDSVIQKLKGDEAFWYANAHIEKKEKTDKNGRLSFSWLNEKWTRIVLWFLILGLFAAVLIWYLSTLNIRLFRKPSTVIQSPLGIIDVEDIFSIDYSTEINKAIRTSNYRQAVRLYYLKSLVLLSQKKLIQYKQDHTNSAYVMQLYNTSFYKDFFSLTRSFEYTWYGQFNMTPPVFAILQKDFETFYRQLPA